MLGHFSIFKSNHPAAFGPTDLIKFVPLWFIEALKEDLNTLGSPVWSPRLSDFVAILEAYGLDPVLLGREVSSNDVSESLRIYTSSNTSWSFSNLICILQICGASSMFCSSGTDSELIQCFRILVSLSCDPKFKLLPQHDKFQRSHLLLQYLIF